MKAVGVFPAKKEVRLVDHPEPRVASPDAAKLRVLEVGVCGTDREICEFQFGEPPGGSEYLVLGHEGLGEVVEAGPGAGGLRPGELVVPMVRLPCPDPACAPCRHGRQDFCGTDTFPEHGIRRAHGFMTEFVTVPARYLLRIPPALRDAAVLIEPLTIAEKAVLELEAFDRRLPWVAPGRGEGRKAVVLGAGPVGLLGAMVLLLRGFEVFVFARSPGTTANARLAEAIGAAYVSGRETPIRELHRRIGAIDVVYEAAGSAEAAFAVMDALGPNGVCLLTGVPGESPVDVRADPLMHRMVLRNQAIVGVVNAGRDAFETAVRDLEEFRRRWPEAVRGVITERLPLEDFGKLVLERPRGIKSILTLEA